MREGIAQQLNDQIAEAEVVHLRENEIREEREREEALENL